MGLNMISNFMRFSLPDFSALLLRLGFGLPMALSHGLDKLTTFSDKAGGFPDPFGVGSEISLGLAVFAEFFCAIALALGLLTRLAVINLVVTMGVAAFIVHGQDPFAQQEKAFLYFMAYVAILFIGPGKYSIDAKLKF
jgi:putative oxidoreductase